jgi:diaminopimelate decarboxylase
MLQLTATEYQIGNVPIETLTGTYGLPIFVYDLALIRKKYTELTAAFPHARIHYACKANNNLVILKTLAQLGAGIDAVSIEEVQLAQYAGFAPDKILFTPNCVDFEEITAAVAAKVRVNIDNLSQLERFGHEYGSSYPVCVRINPHIVAGGHGNIQTGHIDSKFGISIHQLRHIIRLKQATGLYIQGLHMHTGSDILDADVFLAAAEVLFDAARHFPEVAYVDFGSGFKVPYKSGDIYTDVTLLGEKLQERMYALSQEYGKSFEICFEPGKYLVSQAGTLLVKVNVIKQTVATVFAGIGTGLNHLIRPMFYNAYHEIVNVSNPGGAERIYTVVGYICETDTFAYDRKISQIQEGDTLAIANAGAYGYSMSSNYNCRLRPAEVCVDNDVHFLARRRETFDDLIRTQIDW